MRLVATFIHFIFYTYGTIIQSVTYTGYCDVAHVQSENNFAISVVVLCHRRLDTPCTLISQVIARFLEYNVSVKEIHTCRIVTDSLKPILTIYTLNLLLCYLVYFACRLWST